MDWAILFLLLAVLAFLVIVLRKLDKIEERQKFMVNQLRNLRPRQTTVTMPQAGVERAVVTRRDSDDLPATGRMRHGIERKKRYYDGPDSIYADARLPDGAGTPGSPERDQP